MMTEDIRVAAWIDRLTMALTEMSGPEVAESAAGPWRERSSSPALHVTAYGPYDAGKTTLIKRLLLTDGVRPPGWLKVSARPETTTTRSVEAGAVAYVDTPGTASGNAEADHLAETAVLLTDVLLVAMTTRLIATAGVEGRQVIDAVRDHRHAVRIAVTQTDRLPLDPVEQPDEHRRRRGRKADELRRLLAGAGVEVEPAMIHPVSPDPARLLSGDEPPERYPDEEWDGMVALHDDLASFVPRRAELRDVAAHRYWRAVGEHALTAAGRALDELTAAIAEGEQVRAAARRRCAEIDAMDEDARRDLQVSIVAELTSTSHRSSDTTVQDVLPEVEQRILARLERWAGVWGGRLQLAATQGGEEPGELDRPVINLEAHLRDLLRQAAPRPRRDGEQWKLVAIWSRLETDGRKMSDAWFRHRSGMTPEAARTELNKLKDMAEDAREEYFKAGNKIADAGKMNKIEKSVSRSEILSEIGPTLFQLGGFLWDDARNKARELLEKKREKELGTQIDAAAEKLAARIVADPLVGGIGWTAEVASLKAAIMNRAFAEDALADMRAERAALTVSRERFAAVVAEEPLG
ncbi:GTPase domain-containing protein [Actinoplanes sp. CA-252034]|uniref:GTPase domain-containing protein n=1 Tax=Actinoplanes sp. CA-252034 TaxID=3239906 RepID=UPI003D97853F